VKRNVWKRLLPLVGSIVLTLTLSVTALAQIELTMLTWAGQVDGAFINEILLEYEALTGVKVTQIRTGSGAFDQKLQTMVLGGVAPDIFWQSAPAMARYIDSGFVAPLDAAIAKENYDLRDFFPVGVNQYRRGGSLWAIPYDFGCRIIVYNVDAFMESGVKEPSKVWDGPSWTFDELRSVARKLQRTDTNGTVTRYGFSFVNSQRGVAPFLYSYGGTWTKSTAEAYVSGLSDLQAIAAFDYIQEMVVREGLATNGGQALVAQGKAAIGQIYPNAITEQRNVATTEWDIAPWLRGPGGRFTDGGGTGWFLSAHTKYPEEAANLLLYMASRDVQLRHMRTGMQGAARRSVALHPDFARQGTPKSMAVLIDAWQNIVFEPSISTFDQYFAIFKAQFGQLLKGEITAKQLSDIVVDLGNPILKQAGKPVD
jgi:multiple sugar transport system substrate-binding protein